MNDFRKLLSEIAKGFPSRHAFAAAIGINASRLSRALNAGDFPFNVQNCLRLAKLSGESPTAILRAAGKGDVAELIEELYGKDRTTLLSPPERELLTVWSALTASQQEHWLSLLRPSAPLLRMGVSSRHVASKALRATAGSDKTRSDIPGGKRRVTAAVGDEQGDSVPGASRDEIGRMAADLLGVSAADEQADEVGGSANSTRADRQHAAAPRAASARRRTAARKPHR